MVGLMRNASPQKLAPRSGDALARAPRRELVQVVLVRSPHGAERHFGAFHHDPQDVPGVLAFVHFKSVRVSLASDQASASCRIEPRSTPRLLNLCFEQEDHD
jgi:hypothetical protein